MGVFIGGNRDARPHKACKVKEGTVETRWRRSGPVGPYPSLPVSIFLTAQAAGKGDWVATPS